MGSVGTGGGGVEQIANRGGLCRRLEGRIADTLSVDLFCVQRESYVSPNWVLVLAKTSRIGEDNFGIRASRGVSSAARSPPDNDGPTPFFRPISFGLIIRSGSFAAY